MKEPEVKDGGSSAFNTLSLQQNMADEGSGNEDANTEQEKM